MGCGKRVLHKGPLRTPVRRSQLDLSEDTEKSPRLRSEVATPDWLLSRVIELYSREVIASPCSTFLFLLHRNLARMLHLEFDRNLLNPRALIYFHFAVRDQFK